MTQLAPAAMALVMSPEYLMPPSAMTGTSLSRVARAASAMAVICGTPAPVTTRVVQMEPGPMPTLMRVGAGSRQFAGAFEGADVAGDEIDFRELRLDSRMASSTRVECPCALSMASRSAFARHHFLRPLKDSRR